jgi:hypothetical protein
MLQQLCYLLHHDYEQKPTTVAAARIRYYRLAATTIRIHQFIRMMN